MSAQESIRMKPFIAISSWILRSFQSLTSAAALVKSVGWIILEFLSISGVYTAAQSHILAKHGTSVRFHLSCYHIYLIEEMWSYIEINKKVY